MIEGPFDGSPLTAMPVEQVGNPGRCAASCPPCSGSSRERPPLGPARRPPGPGPATRRAPPTAAELPCSCLYLLPDHRPLLLQLVLAGDPVHELPPYSP